MSGAATPLGRAASVLRIQARTSLLLFLQYRADFALSLVLASFWTLTALAPLSLLFSQGRTIAGWSFAESLLVVGWFTILKGMQSAMIQPSMQQTVEHVRKGTLDFLLLKPVDAQLLVSTSRFDLRQLADVVVGLAILGYALVTLSFVPTLGSLAATAFLFVCAVTLLYSIWILVMSLAFVFVKVDNLTYLFSSVFDAARWPASVFKGGMAFLFTFVLPLAVMTTYPALGLLGRVAAHQLVVAGVGAAGFAILSRWVFRRALRAYSGASG